MGAATLSEIQGEEMRFGGRRRVPQERFAFRGAKRIAEELVARPFADMGRGDVADIVEIEAEHPAKAGVADRALRAFQPLDRQAMVVDPLLPVFGHHAPGSGRMRAVVLHVVSLELCERRRAPSKVCRNFLVPVARFEDLFQARQKRGRIGAVEGAMIEALADHADHARRDEVALRRGDDCRLQADRVGRENADLWRIDDRRRELVPKAPLLLIEYVPPERSSGESLPARALSICRRIALASPINVSSLAFAHDRHDETVVIEVDGNAQIDVARKRKRLAVEARVDLGIG